MLKNLLVLTHHFPPMANAASQRALKFVKYLPKFGYRPVVVTVNKSPLVPRVDMSLLKEIPSDAKVFRTHTFESLLFRAVPSKSLFIPDYFIGWYPFAINTCLIIAKKMKIQGIFSVCPPFTSSIVGMKIKNDLKIPYILDLSDPWVENPVTEYPTVLNKKIDNLIEKKVISSADKVLLVSDTIRKTVSEKYHHNDKFEVIPLCYDPEIYTSHKKKQKIDRKLKISYIGSFYGNLFTPQYFLKALDALLDERVIDKKDLDIVFIGKYYFKPKKMIEEFNKKHNLIKLPGIVTLNNLMERMMESDVLLMIINDVKSSDGYVTTKLIEYLPSGNKILALAPRRGEAAKIIGRLNAGVVVQPDDISEIKKVLISFYKDFKKNGIEKNIHIKEKIKDYDVNHVTYRIAKMFDSLINDKQK